ASNVGGPVLQPRLLDTAARRDEGSRQYHTEARGLSGELSMRLRSRVSGSRAPWSAYQPTESAPWNLRRVVHLHRCAAFGAPWRVLERDLRDGPGPSIDRLLQGKSREGSVPAAFDEHSKKAASAAITVNDPERLKAWWIYRMLFGPDP